MSWKSGSDVFDDIITVLQKEVPDEEQRRRIYTKLIDIFERHDCDTLMDCVGADSVFDSIIKEI